MAKPSNPSEIARETLKLLATRRLPPSPDNYRAIYNEIAGIQEKPTDAPAPERELKSLLQALPKDTPAQQRLSRQLDQALKAENTEDYREALVDFIKEHSEAADLGWNDLIPELLRQWDAKQSGLTPARKRESLDRVISAAKSSEILFSRLQSLIRSWSLNQNTPEDIETAERQADDTASTVADSAAGAATTAASGPPASRASELLPELRSLLAFVLENVLGSQLDDEPDLANEAKALANAVRNANSLRATDELLAEVKRFTFRLELLSEDRNELRAGLLKLLQLMVDNVSELVVDDRWLNGQIAMVKEIVARPLNIRAITDAEKRLKEVIFKQGQLKHSLTEARDALKQMLAGFVDHLAEFADSTSGYHDKMEAYVEKISKTDDIRQLETVLSDVIKETRAIQVNAQRSRDELRLSRNRVNEAERRINELQEELDKASTQVRHDQLTGALNRRGLEETFEGEFARANRRKSPLCAALLDIDNFKRLNDTLGHDAGDTALIHLVTVIRETLRPQDTLARLGGEEFIIILPDTPIDDATKAVVRLQRELTKRFFLHDNTKVLITFSAGVTEYRPDDTQASLTKRADEAMYTAKRTGKNKVVTG